MRKIRRIIIMMMIFIIMIAFKTYAADITLTLNGETEVKAGETKVMTLNLNSQTDTIGVIGGKIESNNISNIKVTGQNGWTVTYNEANTTFNAFKAEGAQTGNIMEISYKVNTNATGTVKATISNIEVNTIEYQVKNLSNVTKEISIKAEQSEEKVEKTLTKIEITSKPSKTKYKEEEMFSTKGMVITATYSDGTTKEVTGYTYGPKGELTKNDTEITITYREGGITKTVTQKITVEAKKVEEEKPAEKEEGKKEESTKDENNKEENKKEDKTEATSKLPHTGIIKYAVVGFSSLVVIGIITYKKYRDYKDI